MLHIPEVEKPVDYPRYWIKIQVNNHPITALVDSGAARTTIGSIYTKVLSNENASLKESRFRHAQMANGHVETILGELQTPLAIADVVKPVDLIVLPNLAIDFIFGIDLIRLFKMDILGSCDMYTLADSIENKRFSFDLWNLDVTEAQTNVASCGLVQTTSDQKAAVETLLDRLLPPPPKDGKLPATSFIEHDIKIMENATPIKQRYYPVSDKLQSAMVDELNKLINLDAVEKSHSSWNNPVVMSKKSNDTYRLCIDFRTVNAVTVKDSYPVPYMETILSKLRRARYISTIDLSNAYHQVKLTPRSRPITAFTVPGKGHWQYKRMPFGLCNAGASFQRLIDEVIDDLEPSCYAYIDDIVLVSESFEEHLELLEKLLLRINKANLTINREKSHFCVNEVKYLGFLVNEHGMRIDPEKTQAIRDYPRPTNLKQLRRWNGMCSWFRKFVRDFAKIMDPLVKLTKKDVKFIWGHDQETAFQRIKQLLIEAPLLHRPVPGCEYTLHTDASDTGLGSFLMQRVDNTDRVIAYASRALKPNEKNFSVTEKELLAVKWSIEKFRCYIEAEDFTVITDHSALQWLFKKKNPVGRLGRWAQELMGYNFKVIHRKGTLNVVPDALSRMFETDDTAEVAPLAFADIRLDRWYKNKFHQVKNNPQRYKDWKIANNQLFKYRPNINFNTIIDDLDAWKLVLPSEKRGDVLRESHEEPSAGHLGVEKSYYKVSQHYYWPGIFKDTADFVKTCPICQACKTDQQKQIGKMGSREPERPWESVSIDLIGKLPRSTKGNEYAVVFEDAFSRFIVCEPIRKKTAKNVLTTFKKLCANYGTPEGLITDNGGEFKGTFKKFIKECGIPHELTASRTPMENPVERINKVVKTMIAAFAADNQKEWDRDLPQFQFAYNSARNSATGYTPSLLMFGREIKPPKLFYRSVIAEVDRESLIKGPITRSKSARKTSEHSDADNFVSDVDLNTIATTKKGNAQPQPQSGKISPDKFIQAISAWADRMNALKFVHDHATANNYRAKVKQAEHFDKSKREYTFEIGSRVWVKKYTLSSAKDNINAKLSHKYIGPCTVVARNARNIYTLKRKNKIISCTSHAKDMKPFKRSHWHKYKEDTQAAIPSKTQQKNKSQDLSDGTTRRKRGRPPKASRVSK